MSRSVRFEENASDTHFPATGGVSFISVNYCNGELTRSCLLRTYESLDSFQRQRCQFVIVDNCSENGDYKRLADAAWPSGIQITIVMADRNGGFGYGCNLGARNSLYETLFFLNSDAWLVDASELQTAVEMLQKPDCGAIFPSIAEDGGAPHPNGIDVPTFGAMLLGGLKVGSFLRAAIGAERLKRSGTFLPFNYIQAFRNEDSTTPISIEIGTGAAFLMRRSYFQELGGFDEGFFLYDEDRDLFVRSRNTGRQHWLLPRLRALTRNSSTTSKLPPGRLKEIKRDSRALYIRKHFTGLRRDMLLGMNHLTWKLY
jgi:N-acetylglucosaminyl-diphospho-decaprenol L-rhamnosyltransferase